MYFEKFGVWRRMEEIMRILPRELPSGCERMIYEYASKYSKNVVVVVIVGCFLLGPKGLPG